METDWDCIVIGGGAAGLSAALVLGRARRRTLVVDAGRQSNAAAEGVGGLLGHDGRPPQELYEKGRDELGAYPSVEVRGGVVETARREGERFAVALEGGSVESARRLLLATGMEYRYPDVPGISERWGRSAFHCPFCHGWEVRDKRLGVLDNGSSAARRARLLRTWSDDVTLFTNGPAELAPESAAELRAAGVAIEERRIAGLLGPGAALTAVGFEDGTERACEGLLVAVTMHGRRSPLQELGLSLVDRGDLAVDAIEVDSEYATGVPGVYAAGDVSAKMPSVANAIGSGSLAGAQIVHSLI